MNQEAQSPDISFAKTIISQLGGNRFTTMTGSRNFIAAAYSKDTASSISSNEPG